MSNDKDKIAAWPNDDWCFAEAVECYIRACALSDDFEILEVPDDVGEKFPAMDRMGSIDLFVAAHNRKGEGA